MIRDDVIIRQTSYRLYLALALICIHLLHGCIVDEEMDLMSDREEMSADETTREISEEMTSHAEMAITPDEGEELDCSVSPELNLVISEIIACSPNEISPGQVVDFKIFAEGIDCETSLIIYGDGLEILVEPMIFQDTSDQRLRYMKLRIKVSEDASLGSRQVTILNSNGSTTSAPDLFDW